MGAPDLLVSTAYVLITLATAEFLRGVTRLLTWGFIRTCCTEFIAIFELSAVCYELNLVSDLYGSAAYWVYLFGASVWWCYRWGEATGCPYTHVEEWLDGGRDGKSGALLALVEVIGGLVFYRFFLFYLWNLEYGESHLERVVQADCHSDIQTDPWKACVIEAGGVFICQLTGKTLSRLGVFTERTEIIINSAVGTTLVVLAFTTSGGYFNPALATALQFGCEGSTPFQHVLVYWIGDTLGAVGAYYLWKVITLVIGSGAGAPDEHTKSD